MTDLDGASASNHLRDLGFVTFPCVRGRGNGKQPKCQWTRSQPKPNPGDNVAIYHGKTPCVALDADCPEVRPFLRAFLPDGGLTISRPSKPVSQVVYQVDTHDTKTLRAAHHQFKDDDGVLVELLSGNHYSLVYGLRANDDGSNPEPVTYRHDTLRVQGLDYIKLVFRLAATGAYMVQHLPDSGKHDIRLNMAGFLFRCKVPEHLAAKLFDMVADIRHHPRKNEIDSTYQRQTNLASRLPDEWVKPITKLWDCATDYGIQQANAAYTFIADGSNLFYRHSDGRLLTDSAFRNEVARYVNPNKWISNPQRQDAPGIGSYPPPLTVPEGHINTWRGLPLEPKQGQWDDFKRLMVALFHNDWEWVFKSIAYKVQNPGLPMSVVIVISSLQQGIGKGFFARTIRSLFHPGDIGYVSSQDHFDPKFNRNLEGVMLLEVSESCFPGNPKHAAYCKTIVDDEHLSIQRKHRDQYIVPNMLGIIVTSNETWSWPVERHDRRVAAFDVQIGIRDSAYWSQMHEPGRKVYRTDGRRALLHDLIHHQLPQDWRPQDTRPITAYHGQLMELTVGTMEDRDARRHGVSM